MIQSLLSDFKLVNLNLFEKEIILKKLNLNLRLRLILKYRNVFCILIYEKIR